MGILRIFKPQNAAIRVYDKNTSMAHMRAIDKNHNKISNKLFKPQNSNAR